MKYGKIRKSCLRLQALAALQRRDLGRAKHAPPIFPYFHT